MTVFSFSILSRGFLQKSLCKPYRSDKYRFLVTKFNFGVNNVRSKPIKYILASVPVTVAGAGYYFYKQKQEEPSSIDAITKEHTLLESKPQVPVSRVVKGAVDDINLNLTLFQYPTCPFCCKVRAFLDYYGLPYDVVEVDPVLRQQTSWTTYKKVPILLAKVDGGYQQLNDSSMIVSALKTFLLHKDQDLKEIVNFYPIVEFKEKNGTSSTQILNKYFLMYGQNVPKEKTTKVVAEEKKWREWADDSLVHTLSPNVYRSFDEALQAFKWFSEVGEWNKLFPAWERGIIVYVGASAMWMISKRLKKRHNLKDDVRESLYDECRKWAKMISSKQTPYLGGSSPNLADLAVYGVLSSIEGCLAFKDALEHTDIGTWYFRMKEAVQNHSGKNEISHLKT